MTFEDRLNIAYKKSNSILSIGLDPSVEVLPPGYSLRDWAIGLIEKTFENTLAYKANLSGYVGSGDDLEVLREACRLVQSRGRIFIVDSKVNDVGHTAAEYARKYLKEINADACTVNAFPFLNDVIDPFMPYLDEKGIFVLTYTTSPNSEMFLNNSRIGNLPLWKFMALKVANEWSQRTPKRDYSPIGIVAGPRDKDLASDIRGICDTQVGLVPGLGVQAVPLSVLPYLKKTGSFFPGIIANVGRDILGEWKKYPHEEDPFLSMQRKAEEWNRRINEVIR